MGKFQKPFKWFITAHLNGVIADDTETAKAVTNACLRFSSGDWGEICEEDKEYNNKDLAARAGHVLARYHTPTGDIYINLIFDEPSINSDVATVMYVEDY